MNEPLSLNPVEGLLKMSIFIFWLADAWYSLLWPVVVRSCKVKEVVGQPVGPALETVLLDYDVSLPKEH